MHTFVVIADDFTGANDTGVQLCKKDVAARVVLHASTVTSDVDSVVVDTESRVIAAEEAGRRVGAVAQQVMETGGCRFLYKKIDSTLRGNIEAEVRSLAAIYKPDFVVCCPAYPSQGRTVKGGRLYVHGTALMETEIAADPRNPLHTDVVAQILNAALGVQTVQMPAVALTEQTVLPNGVYTFDAATEGDLQRIATYFLHQEDKKILWIGAAGLAEGLLNALYAGKPALAIVGSISQKTLEQLAYCQQQGVTIVKVDMAKAYEGTPADTWAQEAITALKAGKDVIVTATTCRQDYEDFVAYGKAKGVSTDELANFVKHTLSRLAPVIVGSADVGGIFMTGGDTAIAVIEELHATGSLIRKEVLPGFVLGTLCGGLCPDLPVITKAGAFGSEKDIFACLETL